MAMTDSATAFNGLSPRLRLSVAIAAALAGGALASLLGVPLAWLLGSLLICAALSISGLSLGVPENLRKAGQIAAGFAVGVFFTPEVAQRVLELGMLMVAGGLASILASILISAAFARLSGSDRDSAFFAMMPGGLAEMAGLAHQFGANITVVTLSQSLRIVTIVMTIPPAMTLLLHESQRAVVHPPEMSLPWLILGLVLAAISAWLINRARIFNAWLLGGLVVGVAFGLMMEPQVSAPAYLRIFAQIAIGSVLGSRFKWEVLRSLGLKFLPATIGATLILIAVNVAIAWILSDFLPFPTAILATAPGGIAEMSLTAEAMNLAPPLVAAWQLVRIVLVALLTGPLFKLYQKIA